MIVVDANLLLYAYTPASTHHAAAKAWLAGVLSGNQVVGLPWQVVLAFLRIGTHPRLGLTALTTRLAVEAVECWIDRPNVYLLAGQDGHWALLRRMVLEGQAGGDLVSDAHLAALTLEHGGVLHTTDRDFGRFPGLRWVNPLLPLT